MNHIIFREALAADIADIDRIQYDVFHGEQEIPQELLPIDSAKNAKWFVAAADTGEIVGTVAYWKEGAETHWGRFAIIPKLRGKGIGKKFAAYSMGEIFAQGTDKVYMEARETTVHIICLLGGKVTGAPEPFFAGTVTPVAISASDFASQKRKVS